MRDDSRIASSDRYVFVPAAFVIGNVVAVETLGARLKVGRGVAIADSEVVQIRHDGARIVKRERAVELQPVARSGDARAVGFQAAAI